jgi:predicted nucleic acid-binding protein
LTGRLVILDAGPTGLAGQTQGRGRSDECRDWIEALKAAGSDVAVPEIARYEVRRELFRARSVGGLRRLDHLHPGLAFLPITSEIMDIASELWAHVRQAGLPTADDKTLDADAIVAATAVVEAQAFDEVIIATNNVGHLARFPGVVAADWWTIV